MRDHGVPSRGAFSLRSWLQSFGYAFEGLGFMLKTQRNAWLHLAATLIVIALASVLGVSRGDWRWLIVAIVMVWVAESFNTAVEYLCDVVSPGYSVSVKRAKDIAASAVLVCAVGAVFVGAVTLWPYIKALMRP
jgi:diacylglycerol kinase